MKVKADVWQKAKKITALFEGGAATGNFDGQGLSMGLLQWNLGAKTLQPILKEVFKTYPNLVTQLQLQDFKSALDRGTELAFAKDVMNAKGKKLVDPWKTRIGKLNSSAEFQKISDKYVGEYLNQAIALCKKYNVTTDRAFCLMFDIAVQCWSIKATPKSNKLSDLADAMCSTIGKFKDDVYKRKMAIVNGKDMGRGFPSDVKFTDTNAFEE